MRRKLIVIFIIMAVFVLTYSLYVRSKIKLNNDIPKAFDKSQIEVFFENGGTFLLHDNKAITPIAHDDKETLYVLNGAGNDFIIYCILKNYGIDDKQRFAIIEFSHGIAYPKYTAPRE